MLRNLFFILFLLVLSGIAGAYFSRGSINSSDQRIVLSEKKAEKCIPTFVDGGGPYYKARAPFREKIVPDKNDGSKLVIHGKVLKSDCKSPAGDVVLDIWQANESGSYQDEWYRGRVQVKKDG